MATPGRLRPRRPGLRRGAQALLLGLVVSVAVTGLSRIGVFAGWETRAVDAFLFFRDRVPEPEIVLVVVDQESFAALGERQPISRRYLADLGDFILRSGARVVGFDIQFRARTDPQEDAALEAMIRRWSAQVAVASLAMSPRDGEIDGHQLAPTFSPDLPGFVGFSNAPVGADGVVRRMAPVLPSEAGHFLPSFTLAVLAAYEGLSAPELVDALDGKPGRQLTLPLRDPNGGTMRSEPVGIRTLAEGGWRIDFIGPEGSFTAFPSAPLVALARKGDYVDREVPLFQRIFAKRLRGYRAIGYTRDGSPLAFGPRSAELTGNFVAAEAPEFADLGRQRHGGPAGRRRPSVRAAGGDPDPPSRKRAAGPRPTRD